MTYQAALLYHYYDYDLAHLCMPVDVPKIFQTYGGIWWFALTSATVVTLGNPTET